MGRVLCFGDSLTWGFDPSTGVRFPIDQCWPAVMSAQLGPQIEVIVEGLPGRTTVFDSPYSPARSGAELLGPLLESHAPLDLVVIMLGTNDLQEPLELSARHAASGLWTLVNCCVRSGAGPELGTPQVLVISPPHLVEPHGFMGIFFESRVSESHALAGHFAEVAARFRVSFMDAAQVVTPSAADGVHIDVDGHARLGRAVAEVVGPLLG